MLGLDSCPVAHGPAPCGSPGEEEEEDEEMTRALYSHSLITDTVTTAKQVPGS